MKTVLEFLLTLILCELVGAVVFVVVMLFSGLVTILCA